MSKAVIVELHRQRDQDKVPACVDCRWFAEQGDFLGAKPPVCRHPSSEWSIPDPVYGRRICREREAMECRSETGHCGPEGRHFEQMTWSNHWGRLLHRPIIVLAVIVLAVLFWVSWSKADESVPDSWAAQIEITDDAQLVPADKAHEFDAEFGAPMQPRDGAMEEGGELDPTGKPVDMHIENLEKRNQ